MKPVSALTVQGLPITQLQMAKRRSCMTEMRRREPVVFMKHHGMYCMRGCNDNAVDLNAVHGRRMYSVDMHICLLAAHCYIQHSK